tara:strand:- start:2111 stop:2938 length:828 start_codon:yes stop_codon:yes gene_type:complete
MNRIIGKPIIELVEGKHEFIYSTEKEGISNSLTSNKCLWNEDLPFSYSVNSNVSIRVISNNVEDHTSGTGVKTIRITGLVHSVVDGTNKYTYKFIDVVLNGTTEVVPADSTFYRVLNILSMDYGSGGGFANQGNIKVYIAGSPTLVLNCMKALDNVSNSLVISPESNRAIILEKININAYFHTATELECRIIRTDGSVKKFQKFYLNSNTGFIKCPINKYLESGETFYLVLNPLETIIGSNNIGVLMESTQIDSKDKKTIRKIHATYPPLETAPV